MSLIQNLKVKSKKPYTLIKTAITLDGYIDDISPERLILSNEEDKAAVDELKSTFDAILVGAQTVRKDNPSLLIKSSEFQNNRIEKGLSPNPLKVTITASGNLDIKSRFFQEGEAEKIVYCPTKLVDKLRNKIENKAIVVGLKFVNDLEINPVTLLEDLYNRGVNRLMIEGGGIVNDLFLRHGLVDAMRIAVAPFILGEKEAPRFIYSRNSLYYKNNQMILKSTTKLGDMVILNYLNFN